MNALRRSNPDFEQIMESRRYVYADGHVILNDPKYVQRGKEDKCVLTDEALKHVDDCCLRFVRLYVQQNVGRYVYGRLYYDSDLQKRTEFYLSDYINQKQMSLPDAKYHYKKEFPEAFKEAFEDLMHKNGETQETMADKLGTTSKSLRDWLNDPEHTGKRTAPISITPSRGFSRYSESVRTGNQAALPPCSSDAGSWRKRTVSRRRRILPFRDRQSDMNTHSHKKST